MVKDDNVEKTTFIEEEIEKNPDMRIAIQAVVERVKIEYIVKNHMTKYIDQVNDV